MFIKERISLLFSFKSSKASLTSVMVSLILITAAEDCSASFLTSSATTAKPLPCSPALAASMAAFSASKLVWPAIPEMASA
ncbi:hypothetical protein [Clostridium sp. BL8]|uniref:hypothetical protein n=1 Tax=Clostridium sp. BL8 TaxID=1354301 RepID=UPI002418B783|nr:hypothetical protein [Clostridium sp. BL8]